jgi:hypothetical protein
MDNMLDNSGLSVNSYDATLIGWAGQLTRQVNVSLGAVGLLFSSVGSSARDTLTCNSNWQFNDSGLDSSSLINDSQFLAVDC